MREIFVSKRKNSKSNHFRATINKNNPRLNICKTTNIIKTKQNPILFFSLKWNKYTIIISISRGL